ncbi:MAG: TIGR02302 family protein [Filomicrobium sp.]|nr:TIGR02302 family protein [Filomicrobium sp.]
MLERKIRRSRWALFFERLWPRLWMIAAVVAVFIIASLLGLWPLLGSTAHLIVLALSAVALVAAIGWAVRTPWPTRDAAIRRLDLESTVPHRPATSYEDTLTAGETNATTLAIWQAHRKRLANALEKLRVAPPHPDTPRQDPWALRILLLFGVVAATALVGSEFSDRLQSAFRFRSEASVLQARVDAWITPPAYTSKPPIMLADGGKSPQQQADANRPGLLEIPDNSQLIVRASGVDLGAISLEIQSEDEQPILVKADNVEAPGRTIANVVELRHELTQPARVRLLIDGSETAAWTFAVIADQPPEIALTEEPKATPRGSMKLAYKISDDYGVASARAKVVRAPQSEEDPATAWARPETLTGPRLPLQRPPELDLRLPRANAKEGEAITHLELGSHPWAGLRVIMTLQATDVAGQLGEAKPIEMVLPQRIFRNPLARAVIEQRRKLVEDSRHRVSVERALSALTLEPEGFIDDVQVYLGLRTAYYRLKRDDTRPGLDSVIDQLWDVALRIEDGDLSDAERRLREAQDKLSQALQDGSSDEEIQQAMQELRQALNEYLQQLQKDAQNNPTQQGTDQQNQMLTQQDLERMMKQIEEMAKSGSRDQAQQMLSELRDLLDRLQSGQNSQAQGEANKQMMEMMSELGDIVGQQQRLMDDTFGEQRREGENGQRGQQGQMGQGGRQQGQRRGPQGEQGQMGQGQPGKQGQPGQLGDRQTELRNRLSQLQRDMQERGMGGTPNQFDSAREAMEAAEESLKNGDYAGATQEQARALDQMRQGAQEMARQMMQNMPQRYGQNGDAPRDPLGRPQRSQGPDQGTSVKVPDEIDMQRARQILEELRRRLGEAQRPPSELDYIERLLQRF